MTPIQPSLYPRLLPLLGQVPFNVNFARAVLERRVSGQVFADDENNPSCIYVLHRCGMALLCGQTESEHFKTSLADYMLNRSGLRTRVEMLQVYPHAWRDELALRLGDDFLDRESLRQITLNQGDTLRTDFTQVLEWGRINFLFDEKVFEQGLEPDLPAGLHIARADREAYAPWPGPVLPADYWNSPSDFIQNGVAYAVYRGATPLCIAFSSWILDGILEIGIETHAAERKQGLATAACRALIRHALNAGLTPVWSTSHLNHGSQALAAKLGFHQSLHLPYLRLVVGKAHPPVTRSTFAATNPGSRH